MLRFRHTIRLHSMLAERLAAAFDVPKGGARSISPLRASTANKYLAGLRGVLREAWRLRLMTTDDYGAAARG